ncbi:helix-turn-helix transcriptional regulator [Pseudooceanicola marinus]|uniref:helix-turn-helix transcriptional regulator n=1 Tax=Pseudooceanicola marinus TaxID=396013 RepID=UPI001CD3E6B9|nr:LuxR C-terminal-related transcriptional regulator [Pseudooceanicola marinus]MCA1338057.1 LuxR C-terminal-related transcriptional regulator [Pseudooceanicola marinus]
MTEDSPQHRLAAAIDRLGTPGFEPALAAWLRAAVPFDNITMLAYPGRDRPRVLHLDAADARVHARLGSAYLKGAYLLDPFHQLHVDGAADGLYRLGDVAPDHFSRGEYFLTYYQGTTLTDELAFVARPAAAVTVTICLGRDASSGRRFSARDIAQAEALAPVCLSLIRRHWAGLAPTGAENQTSASVADSLRANVAAHLGIALTPRQAQVAFLVLKGHSTASIALHLDLSPETVKVFRKQLYARLEISSQAQLFSLLLPMLGSPSGH